MDGINWADVIGVGASAATGGIFGLVGSLVGAVGKYFQKKQEQSFLREKWDYETKLLELNMKKGIQEFDHEMALTAQQGSWSGLEASYKHDASIGPVHKWVNDIVKLFRPVLTIALWILCGIIFWWFGQKEFSETLSSEDIFILKRYMIHTTFFAAGSAAMWWFGERSLTPPDMKHK